jgi:CheY-like chemotaxis protein
VAGYLAKPLTRAALEEQVQHLLSARQEKRRSDDAATQPLRGSVLVVDDNRSFCLLLERMLAAFAPQLDIHTAYDLEGARLVLGEQRPDLLLLDLDIGGESGNTLLQEINELPSPRPAVVLLTGASGSERAPQVRTSTLVVHQVTGLRPVDAINCIQALAGLLHPDYGEAGVEGYQPAIT